MTAQPIRILARVSRALWRPALAAGCMAILAGARQVAPTAPVPGSDRYAANLGIYYQLVPYSQSYGARLTQYPVAGSPAAQLQLEPGDMIVALDNQPILGPIDLLNHVARTDVVFVNIRTGQPQAGVVTLPQQVAPPPPPPGPYSLGIYTVPVVLYPTPYVPRPGEPPLVGPGGQPPRRGLRITSVGVGGPGARAGLRPNDVIVEANGVETATNEALRAVTLRCNGVENLWVARGGRYEDVVEVVVDMRPTPIGIPVPPIPRAPAPAGAAPPP